MRFGGKCNPLFVDLELLLIFIGWKCGLRCDCSFAADSFRNILDELTGLQNFSAHMFGLFSSFAGWSDFGSART